LTVQGAISGFLIVDKPAGWTSFDVVAVVRRAAGVRRVGHAGTLDPLATGVLPVAIGAATRLVEYLADARKTYLARVRLGTVTDTYDREGKVVATKDALGVERGALEAALAAFRGQVEQRPPPYSALKREGVPLYRHARAGRPIEPPPRTITIHSIDVLAFDPPLVTLRVECGKGVYVRSLAHDLGAALGVGGSLDELRRTRVGPFRSEDAVSIDALREEFASGRWPDRLLAADEAILSWPALILGAKNEERLLHGAAPEVVARPAAFAAAGLCRAYTSSGRFLGVLRGQAGRLRPVKVLAGG
jgi:tRNA pseudouridine55 synthase